MRSQNRWREIGVSVFMGVLLSAAVVPAGSLEPSGGPTAAESQMYTLEQIYNRLNTGAAATKKTEFTGPSSGPASTGHTLDEIMGKLPALDDTSGAVPANVALGKTYWGLTSGQWGLRTGTLPTPVDADLVAGNIKQGVNIFGVVGTYPLAGVAKTGQTLCYNTAGGTVPCAGTGQDGALQKGVAWPNPRFTVSNGTVTDNLTGLIWLQNADCFGERTWAQALNDANTLAGGNCGLTDGSTVGQWRLPNVKELQSLIDFAFFGPALSNTAGTGRWTPGAPFTDVQLRNYWSSTTEAFDTRFVWVVSLNYGVVFSANKTDPLFVWPVRGGQ